MNIKRIAASFVAAVVAASSLAFGSFAATIGVADGMLDEETGLLYVPLDDGTLLATIPDGATVSGDIVIPETFGEGDDLKTITEVDIEIMHSFDVTTVYLSKSVKRFSEPYFASNWNLREINVDEENQFFTSVDGVLFNKDITEIIKYPPAKIGTSYSIPSTVTTVRQWCFDKSKLEAIVIPNSVRQLETAAFSSCSNLTVLNIPSSVEKIAGSPIDNSGVTAITVDPENTYFRSVDGVLFTADLKTLVAYPVANNAKEYLVPNETEIIAEEAFWGAKNLSSVIIPDSVTEIGAFAFAGCEKLVSIEIPSKITELFGTFMDCYSLETVTLPLSLKTIGYCAFQMFVYEYDGIQYTPTPALKTINYAGVQDDWDKIEIEFGNDILNKVTIYFSDGTTGGADVPDVTDTIVQEPDVTVNDDGTKDYIPGVKKNITTSDDDIEAMKKIKATAPADAFDEDVTLNVVHDKFSPDKDSFAVDISFEKEDGTKVQPAKPVNVKIPVPKNLQDKDPLFVYHINENGKAEKVEAETETIDGVKYMVFEANSFSTYVLSAESELDKENEPGEDAPVIEPLPDMPDTSDTSDTTSAPSESSPSDTASSDTASSDTASSDNTSSEPVSSDSGASEPTAADTSSSAAPSTTTSSEGNPGTGIALSFIPLIAAVSAVLVIKKRK